MPTNPKPPADIKNPIKIDDLAVAWRRIGLDMTSRRYRQLPTEGYDYIDKPRNGWVDAIKSTTQIAIYYQRMAEGKGDVTHEEEKKLKTREERMIKEMERRAMEGSLIDKDAVANELVKRTHMIKSDLLAVEKRLVRWPEARDIVKKRNREMMRTYSRRGGVFSE